MPVMMVLNSGHVGDGLRNNHQKMYVNTAVTNSHMVTKVGPTIPVSGSGWLGSFHSVEFLKSDMAYTFKRTKAGIKKRETKTRQDGPTITTIN